MRYLLGGFGVYITSCTATVRRVVYIILFVAPVLEDADTLNQNHMRISTSWKSGKCGSLVPSFDLGVFVSPLAA